ncbi:ATP-dependent helicase [Candidatus Woesearchaeota archaeon]|nr:ATP-dependent helicase [Candidatus Woesearchaeota archaeon]
MTEEIVKIIDKGNSDEELYNILNFLVSKWFKKKFGTFSEPQRRAILKIHSRENTLVSAPTGSGKTLTAFIAILNELIDSALKGILENKIYCVYVSPLKALNYDIEVNLLTPLKEIEEIYEKKLGIRVGVRTGDTTATEKSKMLKTPPHILITTPESLALMLTSTKFKEHLNTVQWCIIDEIHALAENKRGVHLSLSLERLQNKNEAMTRVGLSATVAPLEEVAKYLVGNERNCNMIDVQYIKQSEFKVLTPTKNLAETEHALLHKGMYDLLHELIEQHKTTLIFTNTRSATERVVDHLKNKYPKHYAENIGAHHGSLSKEHRRQLEKNLREGKLKVVVSSTSLELGIDIGYIDLVICLGSPKSIARFLQRSGRSGHKLHDTIKSRVIVMDRDDLVECSVLVKNAVERHIDNIHIPRNCHDVLAQQLLGMIIEKEWNENELYETIKRSYCYKNFSRKDFDEILSYLAGEFTTLEDRHIYARITRDLENKKVYRRGALTRMLFMTNIGTIPDESFVTVKIGSQMIGTIDEGFLERLKTGDVFLLGGQTYSFKYAKGLVAQVTATTNRPPTVPSWFSEQLPLSYELAVSIGKLRRFILEQFTGKKKSEEIKRFIQEYLGLNIETSEILYNYFYEQYKYSNNIPNDRNIILEYIPEEKKIIFHALYGRRVNDCLSRAIAFVIGKKYAKEVEISINDNGFSINGAQKSYAMEALKILNSEKLEIVMNNAIENSEVFKRRFRHCATRALMILRNYKGHQKRVGRQQVSSMILLNAVRRIDNNFPILKEARREVLEDLMDINNTKKVLDLIKEEKTKVTTIDAQIPSPFAFSIAYQGTLDTMKIEDKHEFLKRMHQYIMAKIGQNMTAQDKKDFSYEEYWKEKNC